MAYTDLSSSFAANGLLTWQLMDTLGENDSFLNAFKTGAPSFGTYRNSTQSLSANTATKVGFDTEDWDTHNYFDTTNNRFLPLVAGKYLIIAQLEWFDPGSTTTFRTMIYKNGTELFRGEDTAWNESGGAEQVQSTNDCYSGSSLGIALVALNGSTDYVEAWGRVATFGGTINLGGFSKQQQSRFEGILLQKAA